MTEKMEAKELMIGDWVFVDKNFSQKHHKVRGISMEEGIKGTYVNDYGIECPSLLVSDTVKPIPLTGEILEKNGFKTNNDNTLTGSCIYRRLCEKYEDCEVCEVTVRLLNGWITIRSFDDKWYDLLNVHFQPRYVHELQHVLRLCGLTELADNFKV